MKHGDPFIAGFDAALKQEAEVRHPWWTLRWTARIMTTIGLETWRYNRLLTSIPRLSDRVLTERLDDLVGLGLVVREVVMIHQVRGSHEVQIPRLTYRLTELGRLYVPVLRDLLDMEGLLP